MQDLARPGRCYDWQTSAAICPELDIDRICPTSRIVAVLVAQPPPESNPTPLVECDGTSEPAVLIVDSIISVRSASRPVVQRRNDSAWFPCQACVLRNKKAVQPSNPLESRDPGTGISTSHPIFGPSGGRSAQAVSKRSSSITTQPVALCGRGKAAPAKNLSQIVTRAALPISDSEGAFVVYPVRWLDHVRQLPAELATSRARDPIQHGL